MKFVFLDDDAINFKAPPNSSGGTFPIALETSDGKIFEVSTTSYRGQTI